MLELQFPWFGHVAFQKGFRNTVTQVTLPVYLLLIFNG